MGMPQYSTFSHDYNDNYRIIALYMNKTVNIFIKLIEITVIRNAVNMIIFNMFAADCSTQLKTGSTSQLVDFFC